MFPSETFTERAGRFNNHLKERCSEYFYLLFWNHGRLGPYTVQEKTKQKAIGHQPHRQPIKEYVAYSAAQCQLFMFWFDYCSFNIIGLARTSYEYHHRFLRTDKNYNLCINVIKMIFNILKSNRFFAILSFDIDFQCQLKLVIGFGFTFGVNSVYWNMVQHR